MQIIEARSGEVLTLAFRGRLDAATHRQAEEHILKRIDEGGRKLVIDLAGLDYISSVGLRVLMLAAKRTKAASGSIVVCSLQPGIKDVFAIAGFSAIFQVFETHAEAVEYLGG